MIYVRDEGGVVRQGFNFYPLKSSHTGFQLMLGKLRIELRWSKRAKRMAFRVWLKKPVETFKEEYIYIPGYTEELKKLYETNHYNKYWGKKYEDWQHDVEDTTDTEKQLIPSNSKRYRWTPWAK
jgi:hypothetical protein